MVSTYQGYVSVIVTEDWTKFDCNIILNHNFTQFVFDYYAHDDYCNCFSDLASSGINNLANERRQTDDMWQTFQWERMFETSDELNDVQLVEGDLLYFVFVWDENSFVMDGTCPNQVAYEHFLDTDIWTPY